MADSDPYPQRTTLHHLAADGRWGLQYGGFRLARGGRVVWEDATYPTENNLLVRVSRILPDDEPVETGGTADKSGQRWRLRVVTAYLGPETPVVLVEPIPPSEGP